MKITEAGCLTHWSAQHTVPAVSTEYPGTFLSRRDGGPADMLGMKSGIGEAVDPVPVADIRSDPRWLQWSQAGQELGLLSSVSARESAQQLSGTLREALLNRKVIAAGRGVQHRAGRS